MPKAGEDTTVGLFKGTEDSLLEVSVTSNFSMHQKLERAS